MEEDPFLLHILMAQSNVMETLYSILTFSANRSPWILHTRHLSIWHCCRCTLHIQQSVLMIVFFIIHIISHLERFAEDTNQPTAYLHILEIRCNVEFSVIRISVIRHGRLIRTERKDCTKSIFYWSTMSKHQRKARKNLYKKIKNIWLFSEWNIPKQSLIFTDLNDDKQV